MPTPKSHDRSAPMHEPEPSDRSTSASRTHGENTPNTDAVPLPGLTDHRCPACNRLLMQARLRGESRVEVRCQRCKALAEARGTRVRLVGSG